MFKLILLNRFEKVAFLGTNLTAVKMDADTRMISVVFSGADLSGAQMNKAQFSDCMFSATTKFPSGFNPIKAGFTKR